jgi:hypothetical protein
MHNMDSLIIAAGVLDDAESIGTDVKDILVNVIPPIFGAWFTLYVWGNSKSFVKTVAAALASGAIWWGIANMETLRDKSGETVKDASAQVLMVDVQLREQL